MLAGNCGFSIAPTRAADREFIVQMFARVEGMSAKALQGLPWGYETFPEYLASLEGRLGMNLGLLRRPFERCAGGSWATTAISVRPR